MWFDFKQTHFMKVQQKPTTYTNVCEISKMLLMDYTDYKQKKSIVGSTDLERGLCNI